MNYKTLKLENKTYNWFANQDSQHPDFILYCKHGEIWVSVEDTYDEIQCDLYIKEQKELPVSTVTAKKIITQIINKGYLHSYFTDTDIGLYFSSSGELKEN